MTARDLEWVFSVEKTYEIIGQTSFMRSSQIEAHLCLPGAQIQEIWQPTLSSRLKHQGPDFQKFLRKC